jgi:hypothetical protein
MGARSLAERGGLLVDESARIEAAGPPGACPRIRRWPLGARPGQFGQQQDQRGDCGDGDGHQKPELAGVSAGTKRVGDTDYPEEGRKAVQRSPSRLADPTADIVGQTKRRQRPTSGDAKAGPKGAIPARERH